jgi:hypothetical protein
VGKKKKRHFFMFVQVTLHGTIVEESMKGTCDIQIAGEFGFSVPYGMLTSLTA